MISQIWYNFEPQIFPEFLDGYAAVIFWVGLGYILHVLPVSWDNTVQNAITKMPLAFKACLIVLIAALVLQVKSADVQPFIYFQF
jgi:hypothetical protein